ncbi:MAG TPA: PRC-barrel domain-containing protein [bacterium]|nr:PRC-barrel domain-containing protein [bacterium]HNS34099.1 PRC-barrel domain-containing protein [bacterium]HNZ73294.1 PRC-barrel domain-containing protein [bacterium]HOH67216.1 PRC-barrel domain-containing protein [bacterium]
MVITANKLLGLLVKDKSGRILGTIKDFEVDLDNTQIIRYIISPSKLVEKILVTELIIDQSQVVEITEEMMLVESGLVNSQVNPKEAIAN